MIMVITKITTDQHEDDHDGDDHDDRDQDGHVGQYEEGLALWQGKQLASTAVKGGVDQDG